MLSMPLGHNEAIARQLDRFATIPASPLNVLAIWHGQYNYSGAAAIRLPAKWLCQSDASTECLK